MAANVIAVHTHTHAHKHKVTENFRCASVCDVIATE